MSSSTHSPIGQLFHVGPHRLHAHVSGSGQPAVVLEAGGGSWCMDWTLVQPEVAQFTQVCSYDRAGFGWSDAGPKPRTSGQAAEELHALLAAAGIRPPYVLVGASFGGHIVRLYAHRYPDEVAGVVLLDARHPALDARMPPGWKRLEKTGQQMYRFMLTAARLGVLSWLGKAMGERSLPPMARKLPADLRSTYLAVGYQAKYFESNLDELAACTESDRQLDAAGSLGSKPLIVVRHGVPDLFARMPAGQAGQAEQVWQELQADLARLSSNSQLRVAEKSGHGIQIDQPEVVVEAIRDVIAAAVTDAIAEVAEFAAEVEDA